MRTIFLPSRSRLGITSEYLKDCAIARKLESRALLRANEATTNPPQTRTQAIIKNLGYRFEDWKLKTLGW